MSLSTTANIHVVFIVYADDHFALAVFVVGWAKHIEQCRVFGIEQYSVGFGEDFWQSVEIGCIQTLPSGWSFTPGPRRQIKPCGARGAVFGWWALTRLP